jgi:hypothetical protein
LGHIGVELRDAPDGLVLDSLDPNGSNVAGYMPGFNDVRFPLLGLADPYGTTYFNSFQMTGVLPELKRLSESSEPLVVQLIELAEKCESTVHSYLVFLGD